MPPRTFAVVGTGVGATVLVVGGITYAMAVGSAPASPSAHQAVRPVQRAAPSAPSAPPAPPASSAPTAPPSAPAGGGSTGGGKGEGRDGGGRGGGGRGEGHGGGGKIYFNERSYSASAEGCISATGSSSFSIFNDSRRTIEVFRGFSCDDGPPVTTVGPHSDTFGTVPRAEPGGAFGDEGLVGSFQVVGDRGGW
ncbi:hypothetical protein [Streptomyces yokosukanensis]|uniref:hypothetical protein n=1 Tax=Streptomyces yokosukanensis TaxID=67386 RepID=UPI00131AF3D7|nr:hypothetical protein [Streptomyces yokosukanensis]